MASQRCFAEQVGDHIRVELRDKSEAELRHILAECESLNTGNCWWVAYELGDVLCAMISEELRRRQHAVAAAHPAPRAEAEAM